MKATTVTFHWIRFTLVSAVVAMGLASAVRGQEPAEPEAKASESDAKTPAKKPEFPPYQEVVKDYQKVVSTMEGEPSLYTIWVNKKDNKMLAELPRAYARQKHFIALTIAGGESYAGLQAGDMYVYWKQIGKRLALIEPAINIRSTGDKESKDSVGRLFTDRVILDVPIVTLAPGNVPVIDMGGVLVGQASKFFGFAVSGVNANLATIKTAKAFPQNVELSFEVPVAGGISWLGQQDPASASGGGRLKTLHYSISLIPENTGYSPRVADQRVGYFTTGYDDLGKFKFDETRVRYINRWNLEKADPSLRLSPPKNPIIFYIEHTTPRRYRYWVKQGVLYWNTAFEKVGIRDAIEVRQQDNSDPKNPTHMEKDPEDVRYNFIRWLSNNGGTAIGPSRVDPMTGEILDADIILTDGWIRHFEMQFSELLPKLAMEGFSPQTLEWLNRRPQWDPRIRLAPPSERSRLLAERARTTLMPHGGHPAANADPALIGDDEYDGLIGHTSQMNGLCLAAEGKAFDLAMLRVTLDLMAATDEDNEGEEEEEEEEKEEDKDKKDVDKKDQDTKDEDKKENEEEAKDKDEETDKDKEEKDKKEEEAKKKAAAEKEKEQMLDGVPEKFIGPLLADLVAHEVGHTLGLRHNFVASSIYSLDEMGSDQVKGKPHAGSVMDYLPINMHLKDGKFHGDHTMTGIGPYDMWAIEYGYSFAKDLKPVLGRVAEPGLQYGTDEDTWGPDPRARRYDFTKNPLEYAKSQLELAKYHRERLLEKFVKEGDSWAKARLGYEMTLALQMRSLSMMANWVGGAFVHRDKKGDKDARKPLEIVSANQQRDALDFVIQHAFRDEAFGLTPELLRHLSADQWLDDMTFFLIGDVDWPVHDRIMGIQTSVLTMLMNPDTLRIVLDNEYRTASDEDMITLPELLDKVSSSIWTELDSQPSAKATARKPSISSLRRNLQREHLERLIDLTLPDAGFTAAYKPISNLAMMKIREIDEKIGKALEQKAMLDPYTAAHLTEAKVRIEKALDAQYIYNANDLGRSSSSIFLLLGDENRPADRTP